MSRRFTRALAAATTFGLLLGTAFEAAADRNVKNNTRTSVNKNTNTNRNTNVNSNVNRNTNVNVNKDVNVNTSRHVDVDVDVDRGWHPVATVATVAVTAAVIGSVVNTLPPSGCYPVQIGPTLYQQCGSYWYQPQYYGTTVQYVVVNPPR
ncbi:MAG: hypothetical protein IPQ21_08660 [Betaproteobacteria bacterium]|jgi:hypothetical protein|nr:hypothetical protein [Betaproteobacteria bacterium]